MSGSTALKKVDISQSVMELAFLMKESPKVVDRKLVREGESYFGIFNDFNFSDDFQNFREMKIHVWLLIAEDVAKGMPFLRRSLFGITYHFNKLHTYVLPHGSNPEGNVIFSVSWRNLRAFLNWRKSDGTEEVPQETINSCLYAIAFRISHLLRDSDGIKNK